MADMRAEADDNLGSQPDDTVDTRADDINAGTVGIDSSDGAYTETDGGCYSRQPEPEIEFDPNNMYDMSHRSRGYALIINQENFSNDLRTGWGLSKREGTIVDGDNLHSRFTSLGFRVQTHKDLTASRMKNACIRMAERDHSDCDCFVLVILSHGEEGIVFAHDKPIEITELAQPFTNANCPSLAGKPRLFFFQACRGHEVDPGVEVGVYDGQDVTDSVPGPDCIALPAFEPDFLFVHSTVPGFFSWRNLGKGSWFVQALTSALKLYGDKYEIQKLLTVVIRKVAFEFHSLSKENPRMKQTSCFRSMLTKDLYFKRKVK